MSSDEQRLQGLLLNTWMPVAALAVNAGMPIKAALAILQRRQHEWRLDCVRVRIDGHNPVHCFRRMNEARVLVLGVWMPVDPVEEVEA